MCLCIIIAQYHLLIIIRYYFKFYSTIWPHTHTLHTHNLITKSYGIIADCKISWTENKLEIPVSFQKKIKVISKAIPSHSASFKMVYYRHELHLGTACERSKKIIHAYDLAYASRKILYPDTTPPSQTSLGSRLLRRQTSYWIKSKVTWSMHAEATSDRISVLKIDKCMKWWNQQLSSSCLVYDSESTSGTRWHAGHRDWLDWLRPEYQAGRGKNNNKTLTSFFVCRVSTLLHNRVEPLLAKSLWRSVAIIYYLQLEYFLFYLFNCRRLVACFLPIPHFFFFLPSCMECLSQKHFVWITDVHSHHTSLFIFTTIKQLYINFIIKLFD